MKRIIFIILFAILLLNNSCLHREFVEGSFEIKSFSDTTLNDSVLIFGHIHTIDWPDKEFYHENEFEIWIENSALRASNDTTGYYSIKTKPGTFKIKCQYTGNKTEKLVEEADVVLQSNKKIEIDFYIGYTIE